jgi:SAM-dependent methyltransferase
MNDLHLQICASPEWGSFLENTLLPWALESADLGEDVLEIGPGPGLTTDALRHRFQNLTAVEVDRNLADALASRLRGLNVSVLLGDATALPLPAAQFSGATCHNMLHHVPSGELQELLFAEAFRVLRPDGVFAGSDTIDTEPLRECHIGDTFVPVDPGALANKLTRTGFLDVEVDTWEERFRFRARKPAARQS